MATDYLFTAIGSDDAGRSGAADGGRSLLEFGTRPGDQHNPHRQEQDDIERAAMRGPSLSIAVDVVVER